MDIQYMSIPRERSSAIVPRGRPGTIRLARCSWRSAGAKSFVWWAPVELENPPFCSSPWNGGWSHCRVQRCLTTSWKKNHEESFKSMMSWFVDRDKEQEGTMGPWHTEIIWNLLVGWVSHIDLQYLYLAKVLKSGSELAETQGMKISDSDWNGQPICTPWHIWVRKWIADLTSSQSSRFGAGTASSWEKFGKIWQAIRKWWIWYVYDMYSWIFHDIPLLLDFQIEILNLRIVLGLDLPFFSRHFLLRKGSWPIVFVYIPPAVRCIVRFTKKQWLFTQCACR